MSNRTNKVADFQFSLAFLQTLNAFYLVFYTIEASALFYAVFPDILNGAPRMVASIAIGFVVSCAIIVGTIYSEKRQGLNRWFFGIISLFFTLKFFGVFESLDWSLAVLSVTLVVIEMNNAQIFYFKYTELVELDRTKTEFLELADKFNELQANHQRTETDLERTKAELKKVSTNYPCRHCGASCSSISIRKRHEAKCEDNPRKKQ